MTILKIEEEIKKEYRDSLAWSDQVGNICYALAWGFGTWLSVSTVMLGLVFSLLVMFGELDASYSGGDLITVFKFVMVGVFSVGAFVVVVFGIPKRLRNVFRDIAIERVSRQKLFFDQADFVESILIRHNVITETEAVQAKSDRET